MEIIIMFTACLAGIVQGVTGFGSGIVLMMMLPMYFALAQSAGISTAICIFLNITMVYTYRKSINFKKILPPAILYIAICSCTIYLSTSIDQVLIKKIFGIFLMILSIYYLFIQKNNEKKKLSLFISLICIVVSAICDGLFGIGGPLMVLYFLAQTDNTYEYLGTIQTFFLINCIYNTIFRIYRGILLIEHLPLILMGVFGIIIGGLIANKIVNKLDGMMIKKLTYVMIGISGLINII